MATQQAWDDFNGLRGRAEYVKAILIALKDAIAEYKHEVETISADAERVAAAAPIADSHHTYTSAELLSLYNEYVALAAYMTTNGYF